MNVSEILITVSLTVAGSVAIAYTTLHLQAKSRRKTLFRALQNEVKLNLSLAQLIKSGDIEALGGCPELHTDAYNKMRLAGELSNLKENIRHELQYTYEMIMRINRPISRNGGLSGSYSPALDRIITKLELLKNSLAKESQKTTKTSDCEQRYIMSQVLLFFTFGLLSIYAYYLSKLGTDANMSRLDWGHVVGQALLRPVGIISIVWAFILSIVALNCKMPPTLEGVRKKIIDFMRGGSDLIVYVVTIAVFGIGFATTWADLLRTGIGAPLRWVIFVIGVALIIVFVVDYILRQLHSLTTKSKTKNESETQNHGA